MSHFRTLCQLKVSTLKKGIHIKVFERLLFKDGPVSPLFFLTFFRIYSGSGRHVAVWCKIGVEFFLAAKVSLLFRLTCFISSLRCLCMTYKCNQENVLQKFGLIRYAEKNWRPLQHSRFVFTALYPQLLWARHCRDADAGWKSKCLKPRVVPTVFDFEVKEKNRETIIRFYLACIAGVPVGVSKKLQQGRGKRKQKP